MNSIIKKDTKHFNVGGAIKHDLSTARTLTRTYNLTYNSFAFAERSANTSYTSNIVQNYAGDGLIIVTANFFAGTLSMMNKRVNVAIYDGQVEDANKNAAEYLTFRVTSNSTSEIRAHATGIIDTKHNNDNFITIRSFVSLGAASAADSESKPNTLILTYMLFGNVELTDATETLL